MVWHHAERARFNVVICAKCLFLYILNSLRVVMSSQESKTLFKKLKETCRKIDNDFNGVKKKLYEVPDNASDLASKVISDIQHKIKKTEIEALDFRRELERKMAHNAEFIQHFKELTAETEVSVANVENYLKQYGYKPSESPPPPEKNDATPVKKEYNEEISKTPNLLDYGITSHQFSASFIQLKNRKSSFEDLVIPPKLQLKSSDMDKKNSDSTPTREIDFVPQATDSTPTLEINFIPQPTKEETPSPEIDFIPPEPTKDETPPIPGLFLNLAVTSPSTPKLELDC